MELIIDVGNTLTKAAIFINNGIHKVEAHPNAQQGIYNLVKSYNFERAIISSVRDDTKEILSYWQAIVPVMLLTHKTPLPITNLYDTPETLGMDRLAAVIGGRFLYPDGAILAIDAGTCITYDFLNANDQYLGGNISPGCSLRFRALQHFTGNLPLVEPTLDAIDLVGKTTQTSILSGVMNGFIREIDQTIDDYKDNFGELNVIICGGEAKYFVNHLKKKIFANQNLVLIGLHKILLFNDKKST